MSTSPPLLIVGCPRSGSTWLAELLPCATGRTLLMEPDDAYRWPEAFHAKRGLGDYPTAPMARASASFKELWRLALKEPHRFSIERHERAAAPMERTPDRSPMSADRRSALLRALAWSLSGTRTTITTDIPG